MKKLEKIEPPLFKATMNDINQITVPSAIRNKYGIESKMEILFEIKGEVSKTEKLVPLKERAVKEDK